MLPFASFEALLETSFKVHIRVHTQEYQYCSTPDCSSIYRINTPVSETADTNKTFFCTTCLARICTTCKIIVHEGMTCQEYQDSVSLEVLQRFKDDNGIKDCPKCSTSLDKYEGCHHVNCEGCGVDLCWVCLQTFDNPDLCYDHMNKQHGGNGLDEDYIPSNDDDLDPVPNNIPMAAFLEGALEMAEEIVALPFRMPGQ